MTERLDDPQRADKESESVSASMYYRYVMPPLVCCGISTNKSDHHDRAGIRKCSKCGRKYRRDGSRVGDYKGRVPSTRANKEK